MGGERLAHYVVGFNPTVEPTSYKPAAPRPHAVVWTAIGSVVLLLLFYEFRLIVLAALIGVGGGVLISPVIGVLKRYLHIPRSVSGLVVVVVLLALLAGVAYGLYSMVANQAQRLVEQWPDIMSALFDRFHQLQARFPWLDHWQDGGTLGDTVQQVGGMLVQGLATGLSAAAGALVILMVGVFTAVNARSYFDGFLTLFPAWRRPRIARLGRSSAAVLRRWFFCHLLVTALSGVAIAICFRIIGIDYWLLLGLLTAALDFIPFVGAILTGGAACIVTLGTQPEKLWWVLAAYIAVQQIEGDVTLPLVMRGNIRLPEAHLLVFVLLMGVAFGLVGMFVAAPLFAVLHHLYVQAYVPRVNAMRRPPPPRQTSPPPDVVAFAD